MRTISAHRKDVHGLAFAPDGHTLASVGGQSAAVWVWDARTRDRIHRLPGRKDAGWAVACGPAGLVAAAFHRTTLRDPFVFRVWRLPNAEPVAEIVASDHTPAHDLAFLPGGTGLVTASQQVRVWDLAPATDRPPYRQAPTYQNQFQAVGVSPDGGRVAFASTLAVGCWRPATGDVRLLTNVKAQVHALAFDPAGRELAIAFGYGACVFDLEADRTRLELAGHQGIVWKVAYTPDGSRLVTASSDGTVRFWDARTGTCRGSFDWQAGKVRCVAVSPDGLTVASGGQDGRIIIADVEP